MLPAVARRRMLAGGANSSTARVGLLYQRAAPHPQSPRRVNLFHVLAVIPSQAGSSAEPRQAALTSGCLTLRARDATLVVPGDLLRMWNSGIKIILFDLVFSCCRTFLSTVLVGDPLHGGCSELCF